MLVVLKCVNDSMHQIAITGFWVSWSANMLTVHQSLLFMVVKVEVKVFWVVTPISISVGYQ